MSAKLLHALTEENPDLQKQIGCMTGIFQIFDRHSILTPRRITAQSHKRTSQQGHSSHLSNGSLGVEPDTTVRRVQSSAEKKLNKIKNIGEAHRVSLESSGPSVSSSSCSSSFSSSHDYKTTSQQESNSSERIIFPVTPSRDPSILQTNTSQVGRHSLDFRDVVKDSMYREARGLSVKTAAKEEPVNRVMMHKDSPRLSQLSKSVDGSISIGNISKPRVTLDIKESLRSPGRNRESPPLNYIDRGEPRRLSYDVKDSPRFSYEGRDARRSSFDSRDSSKSTKLRELPRLSLDSRESYMRGSNTDSKSKLVSKELQRSSSYSYNSTANTQQGFGAYKQPTSVVAKLMGLEGLPNSVPENEVQITLIKICPSGECDTFSRSSKTTDGSKQSRVSSPRTSIRDAISPRLRTPDSTVRPVSPRLPMEPAPWKKLDGSRGQQKSASKNEEIVTRATSPHPSVYAEIEKRLKELEFRQSDRDLRALKQILDSMQAKGLLEAKKEEVKHLNVISGSNNNSVKQQSISPNPRLANRRNPLSSRLTSSLAKGANTSPRTFDSPIVIIKPAKHIKKSNISASSVVPVDSLSGLRLPQNSKKDLPNNRSPKLSNRELGNRALNSTDKKDNLRTVRASQASAKSQHMSTENAGSTVRTSGSVSPRLQMKLELEKRSRPPIPSTSDSSKPRRQFNRQPTESGSPGGKARARQSSSHKNDEQMRESSRDTRNSSQQGEDASQLSDSNNSFNSAVDVEVTSADRSAEIASVLLQLGNRSPSRKATKNSALSPKQNKSSPRLSEDGLSAELASITPDQPSPVSVLDSSFYRDELPSPVKKLSNALRDVDFQSINVHPVENKQKPEKTGIDLNSGINRLKLESIGQLVNKLRRLNSNHNEATTDYIASLCENNNPDHRYISEILLASGLLLRDLGSGLAKIQLHASGHPINPDLFFVLEQTKGGNAVSKDGPRKSKQDKLHRKLVFDAVNELLIQKLALAGLSSEPWIHTDKLARRTVNAQRLLKDLCSEIEQLQTNKQVDCSFDEDEDSLITILQEDVMRRSENWTEFPKEVPVVALDVERLIFKDLIDEIVSSEVGNIRTKTSKSTLVK
ncbi:hypothetical protein MKW94_013627 [Papaver nudicaule]|uniref:DUF4378 domain-containing protein n=1 Tax=Papaver nudicaule TaxID=74823 RepID=A0AA42B4P3_PAPNU|nr:hypothetical protein [Papaver nudicaule]